ncbi:DUF4145 domain-containing protein [Flavobacterium cellulosilyticum]|uniref:DUF4145 domain-containing protein n=1 Tax=Flavobacterium cellulosilyticum TaxID=2541731 RepID=A0A4R5CGX1_9FLAO|nr:DUF4145 domain-containing protein [Flavobacterium cellulosilyticum]TDD97533.1 DUF4145 domain-containing protein [Flavobacterium cellulosilyticum]
MEEKYFCRNCKGVRNHKELFQKKTRGGDDFNYFMWIKNYFVIECLGCENISFLEVSGDTEMVDYDEEGNREYYFEKNIFPFYLEKSNELEHLFYLPDKIKGIYTETILAFKSNSYILTAGGLRAIIEALCNHLKIKKGNLEERIDLLHNKGHLTLSESKRLHSIRFLGNDALHEIEKPKKEHLFILLDIINHLLTNLFINDKKVKGTIETVIDKYEDFLKLTQNKVNKEMLGNQFSLNQILGKSKRLIKKNNFEEFEKKLIADIQNAEIDFFSISETKDNITIYTVEKEPEMTLNW